MTPAETLAGSRVRPASGARNVLARCLSYLTNHVIAHVPSHTVRRAWYRRVLGVVIGDGAAIHMGCYIWFYGPGLLRRRGLWVGDRSIVNRRCTLDARDAIRIGNDVSISPEVMILTAQHAVSDPAFGLYSRPVYIEDHVFIGARAMVLPGVRIGRGAVVAAGAVVTRDVEPAQVVAGVPARPIGTRHAALEYNLSDLAPLFE